MKLNLIHKNIIHSIRSSFFLLIFFSNSVNPEYIHSLKVQKVIDGDTVYAFDGQELRKIRLTGIDAPEKNQPMGNASTNYLVSLLSNGIISIETQEKDRYGRDLARVYSDGKDINRLMVSSGMAWVYDDYVTDLSFYKDQNEAISLNKGIWSNPNPIAPWKWRQGERGNISFLSKIQDSEYNSVQINKACCKICKKGKACGDSCISKKYICRKPPGCACDG